MGIVVNQNRRTNIGAWNWDDRATSSIRARIVDAAGMVVQTVEFELKRGAWQQKSINVPVENGSVRWEINGPSRLHYLYAVEVDNRSNDGTLSYSVKGAAAGGGGSSGGPDLAFTDAPRPEKATIVRGGDKVKLYYPFKNIGEAASDPTKLNGYASTDRKITPDDEKILDFDLPRVPAGRAGEAHMEIQARSNAPLATFYAGMCFEPVPGESDTSNNCSQSIAVTIVAGSGQSVPSPNPDELSGLEGNASYEIHQPNRGGDE